MSNLPKGWEEVTLSEVCTKIQDGNYGTFYPKSHEFLESGIPFLTSKAIGSNGILIPSKIDYISPEKHAELKKAHLKLNDILFTNRGANVGAIGIVEENISHGNIGPQLTLLRANEKITPNFLLYSMRSSLVQKQIESNDSGSAMNFFGIKETSKFKLYLPPIEEQKKIADILSTFDKKIAFVEENINATEELKKGLMQKLLTEGIGHTEFKESELGRIPESWEVGKIMDILTIKYGKSQKEVENPNGDYPILGSGGLMGYANSYLYDKPSVLIGRKGTIDKPQYIEKPFWTVDTLFYSDIKLDNLPLFVYYLFLTIDWRKYNEASGVPSLSVNNIHNIKISIPPLEEQKQIAEILSTVDKKLENLKEKKQSFEELKKGLMQKLLTGEVRV